MEGKVESGKGEVGKKLKVCFEVGEGGLTDIDKLKNKKLTLRDK